MLASFRGIKFLLQGVIDFFIFFPGTRSERKWWCESRNQIVLYLCIGTYITLCISFIGLFIVCPDDALFLYALAPASVKGWTLMLLCTVLEMVTLVSAMASALLSICAGMSYTFAMSSLLR